MPHGCGAEVGGVEASNGSSSQRGWHAEDRPWRLVVGVLPAAKTHIGCADDIDHCIPVPHAEGAVSVDDRCDFGEGFQRLGRAGGMHVVVSGQAGPADEGR